MKARTLVRRIANLRFSFAPRKCRGASDGPLQDV